MKIMTKTILILGIMALFSCSNKSIPSFSFNTLEGNTITSNDLKGKATVLVVWATWCGDCIREIPELNELKNKYKDNQNVMFLAFSDEDEATVNKSLAKFPFNFTHIVNSKEYTDKLKTGLIKHFPQVMVLDKDTKVVFEVTENKKPILDILNNHIQQIIN